MDGKELKDKAFAQGKKHLFKKDKSKLQLRNIYEVQCFQDTDLTRFTPTNLRDKFNFGLAHTLCIAGLWANNYDSKQPTVYYPKMKDGTIGLRVDDLVENFDGVQNMNASPYLPVVYDTYLPSNDCESEKELDKKTRYSCSLPSDMETYVMFRAKRCTKHYIRFHITRQRYSCSLPSDMETYVMFRASFGEGDDAYHMPCNIDRCFEPYWSLPKPMYKFRNPIINVGYHFASSNPNKTMSGRFQEQFEADYPDSRFDFAKFKGKLDKVIRQMSKVKEFHGTLGGLSFLALSMEIPTTI